MWAGRARCVHTMQLDLLTLAYTVDTVQTYGHAVYNHHQRDFLRNTEVMAKRQLSNGKFT